MTDTEDTMSRRLHHWRLGHLHVFAGWVAEMKQYDPLPLPENPTFEDLVFRRHNDGRVGHLHALHTTHDGKLISVTIGGLNDGTPEAPYEMMDAAGETHAPLTEDGVTEIMRAAVPRESSLPVERCLHALRVVGLDGKWRCQKCASVI